MRRGGGGIPFASGDAVSSEDAAPVAGAGRIGDQDRNDMLSTKLYFPRDVLALELAGSKAFPSREQMIRFGRQACGLPARKVQEIIVNVVSGIGRAIEDLRGFARRNRNGRSFAKRLTDIFAEGRASITG